MFKTILYAAIGLGLLGACTTTPEPCTGEWFEYKTEQTLIRFARANSGKIRRLQSFSETLEDGSVGPLTVLRIPDMIEDFKALAVSFEDRVLPELNAAAELCGTSEELVPAFTGFLRKQGVGEDVLEWVDLLGALAVENQS